MTLTAAEKEYIPRSTTPEEALKNTYKYLAEADQELVNICKSKEAEMLKAGMQPAQVAYATISAVFEVIEDQIKPLKEAALKEAGIVVSHDMTDHEFDNMCKLEFAVEDRFYFNHIHSFKGQAQTILWNTCKDWFKAHKKEARKLGFGDNLQEIEEMFNKIIYHPNLWAKFDSLCMRFAFN